MELAIINVNNEDDFESHKTATDTDKESKPQQTGLENEAVDPWALPDFKRAGPKWQELKTGGKIKLVVRTFIKIVCLLCLLYLFICSLNFLSSAFRLLGGKTAGKVFAADGILSNPVAGLMIGLLATVLFQSSSTTTSIVVAMVSSGILDVEQAIPIIMGANIGTSVTNTIVSMGHVKERDEFRRAFAGATVHDLFNWLTVLVLLPTEVISKHFFGSSYLFYASKSITDSMGIENKQGTKVEFLKKITKPFTNEIIQIDKKVIQRIAEGKDVGDGESLIKYWCKTAKVFNSTLNKTVKVGVEPCKFLFHDTGLKDSLVGIILLVLSIALLCFCLICIVKLLHSMLRGNLAMVVKKTINADFPGPFKYLTGYFAILVGTGMTMLVQSSSIFTSALTPLVGIGIVTIERIFPLTLGANIGTTGTAILASLASSSNFQAALQISLCHLLFNLSGIAIWYPIPFMRNVPIKCAKKLGDTTAQYRWFALVYLVICFFILPAVVFGLSVAGTYILLGVLVPIGTLLLLALIINLMQNKMPSSLPGLLRTWKWLPECLRSLKPYDKVFVKIMEVSKGCCV
ncbi:sodium-dependent phosphate transport protein 2B-like isoform X2 [Dendronephthya gigantea]|uniref:sodium-dependent phosphate transport protein 2B-like isoform X2 n=1 Tax=Dendronephthya gigantea TaxID=151771 RepID=UPI0010695925|nr:sodium-dependent phosphate transport protein 2B-like isoform X2 [Dendronephthya gigantea]XP_028405458.1 sodium-dependent phosphate transport protein 2B-like isoform X2 [Dendronephthya gigantea]